MTVNVLTLKQDVFVALRTLIVNNKPTYEYGDKTQTYTLEATLPRTNPSFPIVVLNKANISIVLLNLDGSGEDYEITVQLDFYVKELHGDKAVDAGQDGLRNTFLNNKDNFDTDDGLLFAEDFWDDSNVTPFIDNNQVLKTGGSIVKFILK